ncbi:MAG: hypothetical protein U0324_21570 [Polyangiales bacterium]
MTRDLRRLEALRLAYEPADADAKRALLAKLARAALPSPAALLRYHEMLLWVAAYPDDEALHRQALDALDAFARRRDLARHRARLADTGVVGTATHYRFFWMSLRHLARRFPDALALDWSAPEFEDRLRAALPYLLRWDVAEAVRRAELPVRDALERLRGAQTDAAFLASRIAAFSPDTVVQEQLHEAVDAAYVLRAGDATPSRTAARLPPPHPVARTVPARGRPDLRAALDRPPRAVTPLVGAEARAALDLARDCMITRQRDLAAFAWATEDDVTYVDDGDGLAFVLVGTEPARRLPLPAVHGWVMLRNGIPVGYVQTDTLLAATEVSFNTFPTFRGGEAAHLFSRVLAVSRHVLGARAFSIEPYQLGAHNDEGIATGAFWFYQKLGFAPRDAAARRLLARELAAMKRRPSHRSSEATLRRLARAHVYWEPFAPDRSWLPAAPGLGLKLAHVTGDGAAARLGARSFEGWTADELTAWERLAPVVCALEGLEAWSAEAKAAAVEVIRAKGGAEELAFTRALDAHPPLRESLTALLRG